MKKWLVLLSFVFLLSGCGEPKTQLVRVDFHTAWAGEKDLDVWMIQDEETLLELSSIFQAVTWQDKADSSRPQQEHYVLTLFNETNEPPETLDDFQLFFLKDEQKALLLGDSGVALINETDTKKLQKILQSTKNYQQAP
ncbi:hypothetical protein [Paenisporosarcina cavernae]|uniref:Uncharacterized protein n=1 Tax=Paenisporosarcina cavernae TaxID=2320858 RepID=A0A385YSN9_9BACL|nr:hypothetical protein [Paenisporosarcina cavernae]AYC29511.1 hypothetical protein D3873_06295 [Paenisporosarcina cavernae]